MSRVYWNESVIALFRGKGQMRLYQPHTRRNVLLDRAGLALVDALATAGRSGVALRELPAGPIRMRDATDFTLFDHAYANPAMFPDDTPELGSEDDTDLAGAIDILTEAGMAGPSWPIAYDHRKRGFGDRFKGSFYEQIGTESLMNRVQPTAWWTAQKFEPDLKNTRPTAYRFIQDRFLDAYLAETMAGLSVVDVGCGTGYYTNRMARVAERVVGLDYNADYIAKARALWSGPDGAGAHFCVCDIIDFKAEEPELIARAYDRVVLIDTLLFLFHPSYQPELYENRRRIMQNLRRLVQPQGRIVVMDPNPLWLTPWFGSQDRPFGIIESYSTHSFRVAPTIAEVTALFDESGLAVRRILEPRPHPDMKDRQPQAHSFYSELPPWWVYELQPV